MSEVLPLTQCAAVRTRSPCGLDTTLAVQKCSPSRPAVSVNSAPTAGVPAKARAGGADETSCRPLRARPEARLLAAPAAGVTATMTTRLSAAVSAAAADRRE